MYIEIENLNFKYANSKKEILRNFSLNIKKGEKVIILGESGSGKSTVLRLISGLETPESGIIKVGNKTLVDDNIFIQPEKREIGMVFQDYALFPHMTIAKNILFGLKNMSNEDKNERLSEVLKLVNMIEYKDKYPHELSGGQQQRIALARAIAPRPSLLLFDEPFSNLDVYLKNKIRKELKTILDYVGITAIFVTHDKNDGINIADKVLILKNGEIEQEGSIKEVYNNPTSQYVANLLK